MCFIGHSIKSRPLMCIRHAHRVLFRGSRWLLSPSSKGGVPVRLYNPFGGDNTSIGAGAKGTSVLVHSRRLQLLSDNNCFEFSWLRVHDKQIIIASSLERITVSLSRVVDFSCDNFASNLTSFFTLDLPATQSCSCSFHSVRLLIMFDILLRT